jgi:hypothetical protein
MAGTVKLPVIGQVKTTWVWAGGAVVAVIVGIAYYKHHQAASSGAGTTAAADNSSTAAIDPETGYPEGSAQDEAALQALQESGSGSLPGNIAYGSGYDDYGYLLPGEEATTATANTGPGTFTDNAYWLQYCVQNITGYSQSQIQSALSAYLAGTKLTSTEYSIYQVAVGVAGPPPSPPATPVAPATPTPTGNTTGPSGEVDGLAIKSTGTTTLTVEWAEAKGATGYKLTVLSGTKAVDSETVHGTSAEVRGLKTKSRYEIQVQAEPGTGHSTTYASTS